MVKKIHKIQNVWVPGSSGMVAKSLISKLKEKKIRYRATNRKNLDLTNYKKIDKFLQKNNFDTIIMCAAKVGGIYANDNYSGDFIRENLLIQLNTIELARIHKIKKLVFLGSSCIYPRNAKQPILEDYLLSGKLEKTNESYAIAKIAGIKMIQAYRKQYGCDFISLMPTNLYGENDNFHSYNSHVVPALINKIYNAKKNKKNSLMLWGTGNPKRDLLYVGDLADALIMLTENYSDYEPINIGSNTEITISKLSKKISKILNYKGKIIFNPKFPNGTLRKILSIQKIKKFGWKPKTSLDKGLEQTVKWFLKNEKKIQYSSNKFR
jgi:GDP-L-fucose synthase